MKRYALIEHTADMGFIAYGKDKEDLFGNAAFALFDIMTELGKVKESVSWQVEVKAYDEIELLVRWLNELLYLFDSEKALLSRFDIKELSQGLIRAEVFGEIRDPERHRVKTGVKSATYHMLEIVKNRYYHAQVILDI